MIVECIDEPKVYIPWDSIKAGEVFTWGRKRYHYMKTCGATSSETLEAVCLETGHRAPVTCLAGRDNLEVVKAKVVVYG